MKKIKLLDLCCKAGGCSVGYNNAAIKMGLSIEIVGVDIEKQPNYPFAFIQADAVDFLKNNWKRFTHIHASPPCQEYTVATAVMRKNGKVYKDNLQDVMQLMHSIEKRGVIENVMNAPIPGDIVLRGDMFGLKVLRARKFHLVNWFAMCPLPPTKKGTVKNGDYVQVVGKGQLKVTNGQRFKVPGTNIKEVWSYAMGIDWMTRTEMAEAIPPAYTEYIGFEFFRDMM